MEGNPALLRLDPESILRHCFPSSPALERVLSELKVFEGDWKSSYPGQTAFTLSNPVFDQLGDMLFELRPNTLQGQASVGSSLSPTGRNSRSTWNRASGRNRTARGMLVLADIITHSLILSSTVPRIRTAPENIANGTTVDHDQAYSANLQTARTPNGRATPLQESPGHHTRLSPGFPSPRINGGMYPGNWTPSQSRPRTPAGPLFPMNLGLQPPSRIGSPHIVRPGTGAHSPRPVLGWSRPQSPSTQQTRPVVANMMGNVTQSTDWNTEG